MDRENKVEIRTSEVKEAVKVSTGARTIIRNPENKKLLTRLGSSTPNISVEPVVDNLSVVRVFGLSRFDQQRLPLLLAEVASASEAQDAQSEVSSYGEQQIDSR
jgi:hypothetical protein